MIFCLMRKIQEALNIKTLPLNNDIDETYWHVNHYIFKRKRLFVFVHIETGYTICLYGVKPSQYKSFQTLFINALSESMAFEGFKPEVIEGFINDQGVLSFGRTNDRVVIGTTNVAMTFVDSYSYRIQTNQMNQTLFVSKVNRTMIKNNEEPITSLTRHLTKYNQNPRTHIGFEMDITINLEVKKVKRTLILPGFLTLDDCHRIIQQAFGWSNYHMHEFSTSKSGDTYGNNSYEDDFFRQLNTTTISLFEAYQMHSKWTYIYDFGDGWEHKINFKKVISDDRIIIPRCVSFNGENIPEDVGGIGGYIDYITVIQNENHPERAKYLEWARETLKLFDFEALNRYLKGFM